MQLWIQGSDMKNKTLWLGAIIVALCLGMAVFAPVFSPYPPQGQELPRAFSAPGRDHWLGQDRLGRDILSRVLFGARPSLLVGIGTVLLSLIIGLTVGTIAGYSKGLGDELFMRIVDILQAFPGILLAIALTAFMGPSIMNIIIALSVLGWVVYARVARGQALSLRSREYILAARAMGTGEARILFRHVIPNLLAPLIVQASFGMASAILAESSLSFLGLGAQDVPSWGKMIYEGTEFLSQAPHLTIFPGMAIMIVVLGFTLLGEGLREAMDPQRQIA